MKNLRLFMPLVAILLISAVFVGCGKDDDPINNQTTVDPTSGLTTAQMIQNVIGTYNGKIVQTHYLANSTETQEWKALLKLAMDTQSNIYVKFTDAEYILSGTWTPFDYPKELYSISAANNTYTLKNIDTKKNFTVTSVGYLTITTYDDRDSNGIGWVETFTGNK